MRPFPLLFAVIVAFVALSGCAQKSKDDATSSSTPTASSSTPTTTPTSTPSTPPPPPPPAVIYEKSTAWPSTGSAAEKTFAVDGTVTSLEIRVWVNATASGAYSIQGPSGGQASVYLTKPGGEKIEYKFASTSGTNISTGGSTPHNIDEFGPESVSSPPAGDWKVGVTGTGSNAHAIVRVVAKYA